MKIIILKTIIIWKIINSKKFIFFNVENQTHTDANIYKAIIGIDKKDAGRFLKNEAGKIIWGRLYTQVKNIKL